MSMSKGQRPAVDIMTTHRSRTNHIQQGRALRVVRVRVRERAQYVGGGGHVVVAAARRGRGGRRGGRVLRTRGRQQLVAHGGRVPGPLRR